MSKIPILILLFGYFANLASFAQVQDSILIGNLLSIKLVNIEGNNQHFAEPVIIRDSFDLQQNEFLSKHIQDPPNLDSLDIIFWIYSPRDYYKNKIEPKIWYNSTQNRYTVETALTKLKERELNAITVFYTFAIPNIDREAQILYVITQNNKQIN